MTATVGGKSRPTDSLRAPLITPAKGAGLFLLAGAGGLAVAREMVGLDGGMAGWGALGAAGAVVYGLLRLARGSGGPSLNDFPDAVFLLDPHLTIRRWNLRAEDLAGGEVDWADRPFHEAIAEDDTESAATMTALEQSLRSGPRPVSFRLRSADGISLPCRGQAAPLAAGGLLLVLRDALAEQANENEMHEREARLRQMVEMAPHLVAVLVDGRVAWINQAGAHLLGSLERSGVVGQAWGDLHRHAEGDLRDRLRRQDGTLVDVEVLSAPTLYGGRAATIIEARDVTTLVSATSDRAEAELRLQNLLAAVEDAAVITDADGHILHFNAGAESLFGYGARDVVGRSVTMLMPPEVVARHQAQMERLRAGGERLSDHKRFGRALRRDGTLVPVQITLADIRDGANLRFAAVLRDQSEALRLNSRLSVSEKVLESTSDGVIVTDANGVIQWVNAGFSRISGYSPEEAIGKRANLLKSGLQGPSFYKAMWSDLAARAEWSGEIWNRRKDGEAYPEWLVIKGIPGRDGRTERYVAVFGDISRHKRAEETIRHLTYYDPVTRLPNRYLFQDRIMQALERARRTDRKLALVLISLDRFKTVNETLGHQVGDDLLREVAQRLLGSLRAEDTVSRLRGDTFCCVLTDLGQAHDGNPVINRILDCFAQSYLIGTHELFVTASIGISLFPMDGNDSDDLLQKAETAMNRSKERTETAYHFYTPEMNANSMERLRLETDLRKAIHRNELVLYYQAKVETATGRLLGAEALVRWRHPEYGMVPPGRFIPIAEDTGLILPIGAYVLREACTQVKQWRDLGLPVVRVAVNLSAHQFRQPDLVDSIHRVLEQAGIPADLIGLELTESAVMHNADAAIQTLGKLHQMGFQISIDDFGTGYSSLSYLTKFPIDLLKIDRSFVQMLGTEQAGEEIVSAVVAMAHSLKMRVIAEGVETSRQLTMLRDLSCDEIQGYYFSRPIPDQEFAALMALGTLSGREDTKP